MLAPVLARLTRIPGIGDARVECSGTYFLVSGDSPAALESALSSIGEVLGPSARRVDLAASEAQLAARPRGELWFSAEDIRGLSYVEGRVLAARMRDALTAPVPLESGDRDRVHEAIRAEIFAALDHAHDTGGRSSSGWFWQEWPTIVERISARLDGVLTAEVRARISAALVAQR